MHITASAFLALASSTKTTAFGKQDTGDLLLAVCQCRASPNTTVWCIFDACVHLYLQERKPFKLYVLSAASQEFRRHLMFQGLRK